MTLSTHAHAAKLIRQEMKKHGIKGRVRASSYAGGSSITVNTQNLQPWIVKELTTFCNQFQFGHFDGMQDMYEYSNVNDDLPQVGYVFVENTFDDAAKQSAYDYLLKHWGGYENYPAMFDDAFVLHGYDISEEVYRVLNGFSDDRCSGGCTKYWVKPRVRVAA